MQLPQNVCYFVTFFFQIFDLVDLWINFVAK